MKVINFQFSALGTQSWTADDDYNLLGFYGTLNANIALSTDPSLTAALAATPGVTTINNESAVLSVRTAQNQNIIHFYPQLTQQVSISKGKTYFVAAAAATNVFLMLEPVVFS